MGDKNLNTFEHTHIGVLSKLGDFYETNYSTIARELKRKNQKIYQEGLADQLLEQCHLSCDHPEKKSE